MTAPKCKYCDNELKELHRGPETVGGKDAVWYYCHNDQCKLDFWDRVVPDHELIFECLDGEIKLCTENCEDCKFKERCDEFYDDWNVGTTEKMMADGE